MVVWLGHLVAEERTSCGHRLRRRGSFGFQRALPARLCLRSADFISQFHLRKHSVGSSCSKAACTHAGTNASFIIFRGVCCSVFYNLWLRHVLSVLLATSTPAVVINDRVVVRKIANSLALWVWAQLKAHDLIAHVHHDAIYHQCMVRVSRPKDATAPASGFVAA